MAEAAVAAVLWADDPDTWWHGGHKAVFDVEGNNVTVDAKIAFVEEHRTRGEKRRCLAYMGSRREHEGGTEVRDGVDFYGLAVPDDNATVAVDDNLRVRVEPMQFTVYLVPAVDVAKVFLRAERKSDGKIGNGMVRVCPLDEAEKYRVAGPSLLRIATPPLTGVTSTGGSATSA